jgi:cation diffusion facilitator family transporter
MLSERHWPGMWIVLRTFGVFFIYATLSSSQCRATTMALMFLIGSLLCRMLPSAFARGRRRVPTEAQPRAATGRLALLVGLSGAWEAINMTVFIIAVGKLHPFRAAVGEFALYSILEPLPPKTSSVSGAMAVGGLRSGSPALAARRVSSAVAGVLLLMWASNVVGPSPPATGSEEDRILAVDSIGGMVLLLFFAGSEAMRLLLRQRVVALLSSSTRQEMRRVRYDDDDDGDAAHAADVASAFVGAVGLIVALLVQSAVPWDVAVSSPEVTLATAAQLLLCTLLVVGVPLLIIRGNAHFLFVRYSKGHLSLKVALATATAFALQLTFHAHYTAAGEVVPEDGAPHPAAHIDNLMILGAGCVLSYGLYNNGEERQTDAAFRSIDEAESGSAGNEGQRKKPDSDSDSASLLARILDSPEQRKLACFLALTLFFMLMELVYGMQANSIGLVSDSFHMLLDSASIGIGLYAAFMASWPRSASHPFGFGRYETLSGFTNGVLLLAIAVFIFLESAARVLDPPDVDSENLLFVSVCGLSVNVIGVVFFHEAHAHGHGGDHDGCCGGGSDHNMRGVYLHILADLLGSVSVIASSVVVRTTGFMAADPLCSLLISTFIFFTAWPLVVVTGKALLQSMPGGDSVEPRLRRAVAAAAAAGAGSTAQILHCRAWVQSKNILVVDVAVKISQPSSHAYVGNHRHLSPAASGAYPTPHHKHPLRLASDEDEDSTAALRLRVLEAVRQCVGARYAASIDEFTTIEVER